MYACTKEKYNETIKTIEKWVKSESGAKASDIASRIAKISCMEERDMTTVFSYLTGMSLIQYIKERQMHTAYEILFTQNEFDIAPILEITGFDNQNSFGKRFKEKFNMTPKEAFERKDTTLFFAPREWDTLAGTNVQYLLLKSEESEMHTKMKFGIPAETFKKAAEASDLQVVFSMSDFQSEVAYELAEKFGVSMRKTFEFIEEFSYINETDVYPSPEEALKNLVESKRTIIELCLCFSLTYDDAKVLSVQMLEAGATIDDLEEELVDTFFVTENPFSELIKLFKIYKEATKKRGAFKDFIMYLDLEFSIEDAIDEINGYSDFNKIDHSHDDEQDTYLS